MRELIDENDLWVPLDNRRGVHFTRGNALDSAPRNNLQPLAQGLGVRAPVVFHDPNDNVAALVDQRVRFAEHGAGFARAGSGAQQNLQGAAFDPRRGCRRFGQHCFIL